MAPYEIFQGRLTCETARGIVAICEEVYTKQLETIFIEFGNILKLVNMKKAFHNHLSKDIARSCKNKANLFEQMVPLSLKSHNLEKE